MQILLLIYTIINVGALAWRVNVQHQQEPSHGSDSETLLFVDSIQGAQARALWLDLSAPHINLISTVLCSANSLRGWLYGLAASWQCTEHRPCTTNCETVKGDFFFLKLYRHRSCRLCKMRARRESAFFHIVVLCGFRTNCQTELVSYKCRSNTADAPIRLGGSSLACYLLITMDIHKAFLSQRIPDDDVQHKVLDSLTALFK